VRRDGAVANLEKVKNFFTMEKHKTEWNYVYSVILVKSNSESSALAYEQEV
jgi:hypothetical protein